MFQSRTYQQGRDHNAHNNTESFTIAVSDHVSEPPKINFALFLYAKDHLFSQSSQIQYRTNHKLVCGAYDTGHKFP